MSVSLEPITRDETILIADLADEIWHDYYKDFISAEQINYMLGKFYSDHALHAQIDEGQIFFKIIDNGSVIGFVSYSRKGKTEYFIHKLYVQTLYHGQKIGSSVIKILCDRMRRECDDADIQVRLTVNRQNFKAINFYFRNGFIIERAADFDIGDGFFMNDFVMLLTLKN